MGRKVTDEMKRAMRLIKRKVNPLTAYAAAQTVNIKPSTIYRSKLYKAHLAALRAADVPDE